MIGPGIATVKLNGKPPFYRIVIPKSLADEVELKTGKKLEDRDQVRIWIEPTGLKTPPRKNAFGKYNKEVENERNSENSDN